MFFLNPDRLLRRWGRNGPHACVRHGCGGAAAQPDPVARAVRLQRGSLQRVHRQVAHKGSRPRRRSRDQVRTGLLTPINEKLGFQTESLKTSLCYPERSLSACRRTANHTRSEMVGVWDHLTSYCVASDRLRFMLRCLLDVVNDVVQPYARPIADRPPPRTHPAPCTSSTTTTAATTTYCIEMVAGTRCQGTRSRRRR